MSVNLSEQEYERTLELITELKQNIAELEALFYENDDEERSRKYRLLVKLHKEGGVISKQRFNDIALEVGYPDLRGPQGMFAYGGKYVTKIAGDRVGITQRAIDRLRQKDLI